MEPDVERILDESSRKAGLSDFGDDWFHRPLEAWMTDLGSENLNEFGQTFLYRLVSRDLVRRLRVLDTLQAHPEILDVAIPPIVYITGLERSGTTLLHNLLALHADARALLRWELMEPVPPPTHATFATDPRIAQIQTSADKLRGSMLERMHWVNATDPEECVWGFVDCVGMLGQAAGFCMPAWREFLWSEDLSAAYRNYRQVIQILLWKNPVPPGGFLVLKAPQISRTIDEFAAVFPEARFVVTDRDPFRVATSVTAMVESIVDPFCHENPVSNDGARHRLAMSRIRAAFPRLTEFTESEPARVHHLRYSDLVAGPGESVDRVLADLGVAPDEGLPARIDAFLSAQRAGRRARPPASLPTMGYDHDEVLTDPVVAAYCDRFSIEPERSRMTG